MPRLPSSQPPDRESVFERSIDAFTQTLAGIVTLAEAAQQIGESPGFIADLRRRLARPTETSPAVREIYRLAGGLKGLHGALVDPMVQDQLQRDVARIAAHLSNVANAASLELDIAGRAGKRSKGPASLAVVRYLHDETARALRDITPPAAALKDDASVTAAKGSILPPGARAFAANNYNLEVVLRNLDERAIAWWDSKLEAPATPAEVETEESEFPGPAIAELDEWAEFEEPDIRAEELDGLLPDEWGEIEELEAPPVWDPAERAEIPADEAQPVEAPADEAQPVEAPADEAQPVEAPADTEPEHPDGPYDDEDL